MILPDPVSLMNWTDIIYRRIQPYIDKDTKKVKCTICPWFKEHKFNEFGQFISKELIGFNTADILTQIKSKEKEITDEKAFKTYHNLIHRVLIQAAILGSLFHLIQNIPPLIALLKWYQNSLRDPNHQKLQKQMLESIIHYIDFEVKNKKIMSFIDERWEIKIEDLYEKIDEIRERVSRIKKSESSHEIDNIIRDLEQYNKTITALYNEFSLKFNELTISLRLY